MKETFKIILVLTLVCISCAFFLALVDTSLARRIETNTQDRIKNAISKLAPEAVKIDKIDTASELIYKLRDKKNKLIGYAFIAWGQGYQGKIKMLVVIGSDLNNLVGIEVVESLETPGLGAKIQESAFRDQFKNLDVEDPIKCLKEKPSKNNQIMAITGATVSSNAVVNILNARIKSLRDQLK